MENQIKVLGKQNFMGIQIPVISGGFGEGKKCITPHTIAEIHNMEVREVNQAIKRLIAKGRIKEDIHYIDILNNNFNITVSDLEIKLSNNVKNYYILSERGYSSLIKYMDDDKSWEVMDKLVNEYFRMREAIQSNPNNINAQLAGMIQSTMTAIMPIVIEQFAPIVLESKQIVDNMTNLLHDQSEIYDNDRNQIKSLIGFKSANTRRIVDTIKDMLSEKYGYKIYKKDKAFLKVKKEVFKRFEVIKWEDIPVEKFNQVFAFVDTYIEDLKVCC